MKRLEKTIQDLVKQAYFVVENNEVDVDCDHNVVYHTLYIEEGKRYVELELYVRCFIRAGLASDDYDTPDDEDEVDLKLCGIEVKELYSENVSLENVKRFLNQKLSKMKFKN